MNAIATTKNITRPELRAFISEQMGKECTHAMLNSLEKQGLPFHLSNGWGPRPTKIYDLQEVLDWYAKPRTYKVPSRHGVREVLIPGVTLAPEMPQLEEGEEPDWQPEAQAEEAPVFITPDTNPFVNEETGVVLD
jgi:hypothetical protein